MSRLTVVMELDAPGAMKGRELRELLERAIKKSPPLKLESMKLYHFGIFRSSARG